VPPLSNSIEKYLKAVKPLLTKNEYENTEKIAFDFSKDNGLGQKLQTLLIQRSKEKENWLSEWWLNKIYLEGRYNLPINSNPGQLFPKANFKGMNELLVHATKYIHGFLNFKHFLDEQQLEPEKLGTANLCMDQYYKIIGTTRTPNKDIDNLKMMHVYNIDLEKTNHITVMFANKIFSLKVIDSKTGQVFEFEKILSNLKHLVELNIHSIAKTGLGIMTAENRDIWAQTYKTLSDGTLY
jgi:hypothetical protein